MAKCIPVRSFWRTNLEDDPSIKPIRFSNVDFIKKREYRKSEEERDGALS